MWWPAGALRGGEERQPGRRREAEERRHRSENEGDRKIGRKVDKERYVEEGSDREEKRKQCVEKDGR